MLKNSKFLGVLSTLSFAASLVITAPASAQSTVVMQKQNTAYAIDGNLIVWFLIHLFLIRN